jgi:hypothetical protein
MDEHEMVNAELTRSHSVSRSAANVKAELDFVARLISGLPTNVEPGEYEAALATHLTSLSTALQLELEQTHEETSGTSRHVRRRRVVVPSPVARWPAPSSHSSSCHRRSSCLRALGSRRVCAI